MNDFIHSLKALLLVLAFLYWLDADPQYLYWIGGLYLLFNAINLVSYAVPRLHSRLTWWWTRRGMERRQRAELEAREAEEEARRLIPTGTGEPQPPPVPPTRRQLYEEAHRKLQEDLAFIDMLQLDEKLKKAMRLQAQRQFSERTMQIMK